VWEGTIWRYGTPNGISKCLFTSASLRPQPSLQKNKGKDKDERLGLGKIVKKIGGQKEDGWKRMQREGSDEDKPRKRGKKTVLSSEKKGKTCSS